MRIVKRRRLIDLAFARLLSHIFPLFERLGVHVTLNHFYGPVPDSRTLQRGLWTRETAMIGVEIDEVRQLQLLDDMVERFRSEYEEFPASPTSDQQFSFENQTFLGVDAEILYCFIRSLKSRTIIEIGSGQSTYLIAQALRRNAEQGAGPCEYVVVDPYPLDPVRRGVPGVSELVIEPVETVDLSLFERLGANDILFIDTSHVLRIGGDVQREFLEILPRLRPGVLVQIHDIFLPVEYPREWVIGERLFYNEQYLLQAFLTFNDEFEVVWAGHYLHLRHPDRLAQAFPSYDPRRTKPGSFWIRRRGNTQAGNDAGPSAI